MQLSKIVSRMAASSLATRSHAPKKKVPTRLTNMSGMFDNPGNLGAHFYVPPKFKAPGALVVVLHGCTQDAASYDQGTGWSRLADRHGFALLFPEQRRSNNFNLCFNWYQPGDAARDAGEPASIRAMIARMIDQHPIDREQIYVTGLSAGGAMASTLLATYPEIWAGGAIIAGLPFGVATNLHEAFETMSGRRPMADQSLGDAVRGASSHSSNWPRISVWHGTSDALVVPDNASAIVRQWLTVHGLPATPTTETTVEGYPHRIWAGPDGAPLVEEYVITDMAHGAPLAPGRTAGRSGKSGAHMLDVGISSTDRIASFFGLADARSPTTRSARDKKHDHPNPRRSVTAVRKAKRPDRAAPPMIQDIIENALRTAGLMR